MIDETPKANRTHIGFFGRCNAGKSTLINMLTDQPVSLVASVAGTTTDPVSKAMEILPLGPVVITDTAGVDDTSDLGPLRIEKTKALLPKMNMAVYVLRTDTPLVDTDKQWLKLLQQHKLPVALFLNEVGIPGAEYIKQYPDLPSMVTAIGMGDFSTNQERLHLLALLGQMNPVDTEAIGLLDGVVHAGDTVVLVCPIDSAAPKGRLILPQVQAIREVLDKKAMALVIQTDEIPSLLASLQKPPTIVITDSQAFKEVDALVPTHIPLTSFSILMARYKGRLPGLVQGVRAVQQLHAGSKVLISEGCTHRRQCDDIGTVKIPQWLAQRGYTDLDLQWTSGGAFPDNVSDYDLIIHCGACMLTRREVLRRMDKAHIDGVPIVNYGVLIAMLHGILERAISPFMKELGEEM